MIAGCLTHSSSYLSLSLSLSLSPVQKKEVGKFVFDQVLRRLSLPDKDKDYFGMEYEDDQKVPVRWLECNNNNSNIIRPQLAFTKIIDDKGR